MTPMDSNEDILTVFQELPDHQRSELQRLIDDYSSACRLSQGSRLDQLAYWKNYWKMRALCLEHDLRKQLGLD